MASIEQQLDELVLQKNALAVNIAIRGIPTSNAETLNTLVPKVLDIQDGGWEPHPDWWNIKQIFTEDIPPTGYEKRSILLLIDSDQTTALSQIQGNYFRTSDGYTGPSVPFYSWDTSKDKVCSDGYKTRYIIVYTLADIRSLSLDYKNTSSLWIYVENTDITSISMGAQYVGSANALIQSFEIGENVEYKGTTEVNYMFSMCLSLQKVQLPKGITPGTFTFWKCSSLVSVVLPDGVTKVTQYMFSECTNIRKIALPSTITSIETNGLRMTSSLRNIALPTALEIIGDYAFYLSGITKIEIPLRVTSIGREAFYSAPNLEEIFMGIGVSNYGNSVFAGLYLLKVFKTPYGYLPPSVGIVFTGNAPRYLSISGMVELGESLADNMGNTPIPITLGAVNVNKLTTEQKTIFTNKNYTLS